MISSFIFFIIFLTSTVCLPLDLHWICIHTLCLPLPYTCFNTVKLWKPGIYQIDHSDYIKNFWTWLYLLIYPLLCWWLCPALGRPYLIWCPSIPTASNWIIWWQSSLQLPHREPHYLQHFQYTVSLSLNLHYLRGFTNAC